MVLRIGRSAYDTDDSLLLERRAVESLGHQYQASGLDSESMALLSDAEMLVVNSGVVIDGKLLGQFGEGAVLTTTSGYDHIALDVARSMGIAVARAPQVRRDAVAEHAITEMVTHLRRLDELNAHSIRGDWARGRLVELQPRSLRGAVVAVVGFGVIGSRVTEVLRMLGAKVLIVDPAVDEGIALEKAILNADIVSLHCDLNDTSRMMFNAEWLSMMKRNAVLVNTARGGLVDIEAAVEAVKRGRIQGFSSDVFPQEPYSELSACAHPGVRFTPHASGYTTDLPAKVATAVKEAVTVWATEGRLPHQLC